jgi:hypothetical protein
MWTCRYERFGGRYCLQLQPYPQVPTALQPGRDRHLHCGENLKFNSCHRVITLTWFECVFSCLAPVLLPSSTLFILFLVYKYVSQRTPQRFLSEILNLFLFCLRRNFFCVWCILLAKIHIKIVQNNVKSASWCIKVSNTLIWQGVPRVWVVFRESTSELLL